MLLTEPDISTDASVTVVNSFGEFINRYGFMILFSIIMLLVIIFIANKLIQQSTKRADAELELTIKERNSSIEQNTKMFNLVTEVQTQQVVQLQQMTESLKEMNASVKESQAQMNSASESFNTVKDSIIENSDNQKLIRSSLEEVLNYVKSSSELNSRILEKVELIEKEVLRATKEKTEVEIKVEEKKPSKPKRKTTPRPGIKVKTNDTN